MAEQGFAVEFNIDPQGSELDQAALSTDTVLYLGDASTYDVPGTVEINGARYDTVAADVDAGTLTLATPLGVAADVGDRVYIISGGEVAYDHTLEVQTADGESLELPVDYADRAFWEIGPIDPPVPVLVSDDLTQIVDVPGRTTTLAPSSFVVPLFVGHLDVNQSIPNGAGYTIVQNWVVDVLAGGMQYNAAFHAVEVPLPGYYSMQVGSAVAWASSSVGRRAIQPWFSNTAFGAFGGGEFKQDAPSTAVQQTTPVVTPIKQMDPGWRISLQVSQTSGGALDLIGNADGTASFFCVKYEGPA